MSPKYRETEIAPARTCRLFPIFSIVVTAVTLSILASTFQSGGFTLGFDVQRVPIGAQAILAECDALTDAPGPAASFHEREESDRFEPGTKSTLIRDARIWTGEQNGTVEIRGDIFLEKGIIKAIGQVPRYLYANRKDVVKVHAEGKWVTPGLVDLHSHLGILSSPVLSGAIDLNSNKGPILPWLRSVDGLNTHDDGFELAIAGGVTSVQVLPGSTNAIGGQSFFMKLRRTSDRTPTSMLIEPPYELVGGEKRGQRWRHMKSACGENLRQYGNRMDNAWSLREAFNSARKLKDMQDVYCSKARAGQWDSLGLFPKSLQWEALVDVLRGRVKVSTHCYETVDLDSMVRLSQEFEFPIAAFHHAAEAWLVPDLLKQTYGGTPAVALFATNYRYKREAFRGSEFAPRVLSDAEIPVVMKSDHPVINSRFLLYEAQQAHHFGLPAHIALASVTLTPATTAGLVHRIGKLTAGADADVVLWDSHPLQLGATPIHVWIDGIMQIPLPPRGDESHEIEVGKGKEDEKWLEVPKQPTWDKERKAAIAWDGLPPLQGRRVPDRVLFRNVKEIWSAGSEGIMQAFVSPKGASGAGDVIVEHGRITCTGLECGQDLEGATMVDLDGGSLFPGLMTYGSPISLEEIEGEMSTGDGKRFNAFTQNIPEIYNDVGNTLRAADALVFGTRNALLAYRSGVTTATTVFQSTSHIISGLSVTVNTGSSHVFERGALLQDVTALHVKIGRTSPTYSDPSVSVSSQVGGLRRLLFGWENKDQETGDWFRKAAEGVVPLVIEVHSADIMANLLMIKAEVEDRIGSNMRMVFSGASEAHLIAKDIGNAGVGVILIPTRAYPFTWQERRILAGPPLTNETALTTLLGNEVKVALGIRSGWEAHTMRLNLQWARLESGGRISEHRALAMVTADLEDLLGIRGIDDARDMVAYSGGGIFDQSSKVVGVISQSRGAVDLF